MRLLQTLLAASLLLLSASCGGSDPDALISEGSASLSKDPKAALACFDEALGQIDSSHARFVEAKLGQLKAQSYTDPKAAKAGFLAFAGESKLETVHYQHQVDALYNAAKQQAETGAKEDVEAAGETIGLAIAVLVAGKETFPGVEKFDLLIDLVGKKGEEFGTSDDAMKLLEGLGYVGD
jgi:hypothetical protein